MVVLSRSTDGQLRHRGDGGAAAASEGAASGAPGEAKHVGLGELLSTSIAGNDLLSSCLYTGGICAGYAGKLAPLSLLLVSVMLYFFRFVYGEVVTAMPMNGGSYTALNNTTSKRIAALAACLSMLSYVATAVVSAESAVQYLQLVAPGVGTLLGTVVVLGIFAALSLVGLGESAGVAAAMFVLHVAVLCVLSVWSLVYAVSNDWAVFRDNLRTPYPEASSGSAGLALYFGYSAALLGITGFETAANYVEEMKDSRTYINTLRNLWLSVSLFNPVLGLLAMAVMPLGCEQVAGCADAAAAGRPDTYDYIYKYQSNLLGPVAGIVGGPAFKTVVCIDGVIVLAGSVLTAYVGIVGLVRRMALDRCLPAFLLHTNALRGTQHWIILGFFGICTSLLLALNGDVDMLSSVYNIAFLSVMTAFALACGVLKWKRPNLSRLTVTSTPALAAALILVLAGLLGNILRAPIVLAWFSLYFGTALVVVFSTFNATSLLGLLRRLVKLALPTEGEAGRRRRKLGVIVDSHERKERHGAGAGAGETEAGPAFPSLNSGEAAEGEGGGTLGSMDDSDRRALLLSHHSALPHAAAHEAEERGVVFIREDDLDHHEDDPIPGAALKPGDTGLRGYLLRLLGESIHAINATPMVYFAKDGDLCTLNKAINYVRDNEQTSRLVVVHCVDDLEARRGILARGSSGGGLGAAPSPPDAAAALEASLPPLTLAQRALIANVALLDAVYPKLRVDCIIVRGSAFSLPVVRWVSRHLGIGTNFMFMAMPDEYFPHKFSGLGGLRIITRADPPALRQPRAVHTRAVLLRAGRELQEE